MKCTRCDRDMRLILPALSVSRCSTCNRMAGPTWVFAVFWILLMALMVAVWTVAGN